MGSRRTVIVAVLVTLVLVALVGVARVRLVYGAQREYAAMIERYLGSYQDYTRSVLSAPGDAENVARPPVLRPQDLRTHQVAIATAGTAGAVAGACAACAACFAIAWFTGSMRSVFLAGAWAWFVSGAAVGAVARNGFALTERFTHLSQIAPPVFPGGTNAALVLAGLSSAFLWQTVLPGALGGYVGLKAHVWRAGLRELDAYRQEPTESVEVPVRPAPATSRRCACGAANLITNAACYACGAPLFPAGRVVRDEGV